MPKLIPTKKNKLINLIPQDDFESSTLGRILKWALSTFRILVIFTELVVMAAFLSRFWLDARNSDLNEELNVRKSQVIAYKQIEDEFRSYQEKLKVLKTVYSDARTSSIINNLSRYLPQDVSLNSVSFLDNNLQIRATALSEGSIAQLLVNMQKNKEFKEINLGQISSSAENPSLIVFTLNTTLNNGLKGGSQ